MKAKILTIVALAAILSLTTKNIYATTSKNDAYVVLNDIKAVNKIEVYGNVELFITSNMTEKVQVYNKYYSESALVQSRKGVLRISSYNNEKLIVWVSANDLRSVSAFDNAEVRSFGNVSNIEFSVDLHNNATAKLNLDVYNADITLKDNSKIELSGTANQLTIDRNINATLTDADFTAEFATDHMIVAPVIAKNDEIIGLE